ncbi:hypothetical protein A4H97_31060 [Niastella yeongjuensis]|uniref:Uncharacterized protein n=1 Tax=Niastella yeongjuensis TaxID=354355 RepID=A0A1V9EPI8_9BACT|nr:hypothetical protein A4H97_31060 [Niastella yeongjuensis]
MFFFKAVKIVKIILPAFVSIKDALSLTLWKGSSYAKASADKAENPPLSTISTLSTCFAPDCVLPKL